MYICFVKILGEIWAYFIIGLVLKSETKTRQTLLLQTLRKAYKIIILKIIDLVLTLPLTSREKRTIS